MANDLLNSFIDASSRYNHIVFDSRTQRFERAGLRHAIATFFGSAEATAKNKATLDAIKIGRTAAVAASIEKRRSRRGRPTILV